MNALPWYAVAGLAAAAYSLAVRCLGPVPPAVDQVARPSQGQGEHDGQEADEPPDAEREADERLAEWARKEAAL